MKEVIYFEKTFELYIHQEELDKIVSHLANKINEHYANIDHPLVLISILDGSFIFMADLIRKLNLDVEIQFVKLKSYEGTSSRGEVAHILKLSKSLKNKHALIIEDIIDTGLTIEVLLEELKKKEPQSLKVCTLLSKPDVHNDIISIDFIGKNLPPEFVIGYGLDINGKARHLPDIYKLKV